MGLLGYAEFQSHLGVSVTAAGPQGTFTIHWVFNRQGRQDRIVELEGLLVLYHDYRGASTAKPSHSVIV